MRPPTLSAQSTSRPAGNSRSRRTEASSSTTNRGVPDATTPSSQVGSPAVLPMAAPRQETPQLKVVNINHENNTPAELQRVMSEIRAIHGNHICFTFNPPIPDFDSSVAASTRAGSPQVERSPEPVVLGPVPSSESDSGHVQTLAPMRVPSNEPVRSAPAPSAVNDAPAPTCNAPSASRGTTQQLAHHEELRSMVGDMAGMARVQDARLDLCAELTDEAHDMGQRLEKLGALLRQERASFQRMRMFLDFANPQMPDGWREEDVWDRACRLREDERGDMNEVETDEENE